MPFFFESIVLIEFSLQLQRETFRSDFCNEGGILQFRYKTGKDKDFFSPQGSID